MNWLFNKKRREVEMICCRNAIFNFIKSPFHKIDKFFNKFFPRFHIHHINKMYITECNEHYYKYTGCTRRSLFHNLVGKRFVRDYYRAMNEIQEKLYNWFVECWDKVYPGIPYDKLEIVKSYELCINCEAENVSRDIRLAIDLSTDYYIKVKNKEWWKVIDGVVPLFDGKPEIIGDELFDIRTYLQK